MSDERAPWNTSDDVWRRAEIESPCVKICVIEPRSDLCLGCLRSRAEIAGWSRMSPEARRAVTAELSGRAPRLNQGRRGGRAGRRASSE